MDDPRIEKDTHVAALRGLRRLNAASGVVPAIWSAIRRIARKRGLSSVSLLDVASGAGGVLASLARRARANGLQLSIQGCDVSPRAVEIAASTARRAGVSIDYFVADAITDPLPHGHDLVTSSLFLHHLARPEAVGLLEKLGGLARHAVLIDDLERTRAGYLLVAAGCRLLSRSPVVHHDGPASVRAAFSLREARELADEAGLGGARFTRHWPCRYLMEWARVG